jgi:hypothetical protein
MRKPSVDEAVDQDPQHHHYQGLPMLSYRAALPLSSRTLNYAAGSHPPSPEVDRVAVAEAEPVLPGQARDESKAGLVALADKGYQGSTWAKAPYKGRNKPEPKEQANRVQARLHAPGERGNAQLKVWKILTKLRCCPWRAGKLAKAIHVLQIHEA